MFCIYFLFGFDETHRGVCETAEGYITEGTTTRKVQFGSHHSLVQVEEDSAHESALGESLLGVSRGECGVVQALDLLALHEPGEGCQHDGGHDGHHPVQVTRVHVLALGLVHRCLRRDGRGRGLAGKGGKTSQMTIDHGSLNRRRDEASSFPVAARAKNILALQCISPRT